MNFHICKICAEKKLFVEKNEKFASLTKLFLNWAYTNFKCPICLHWNQINFQWAEKSGLYWYLWTISENLHFLSSKLCGNARVVLCFFFTLESFSFLFLYQTNANQQKPTKMCSILDPRLALDLSSFCHDLTQDLIRLNTWFKACHD